MTEVLQTPIKSSNDKNFYRLIKLENGLKVLLIQHESEEKQAALVMNIDVGGYDDPKAALGLSHFLEHMVFMGSEKYPKENEYHEFVSSHGGDLNAMTGFKDTIFFFMISDDALEGAIDRFSSIFVSPLMLENSIERELDSIESEFRNRMNSDMVKLMQLLYEYVSDDHQAKVFLPGNLKTLKENRSNSELYQLVHEHRRKFYVANRMTLALESSKNLDELQKIVENYFNGIQSGLTREEIPQEFKNIFKPQFFEKLIYMKPKTDKRMLTLYWPMPRDCGHYKSKPLRYLQRMIESEYDGGLESYLKKKLLITSLYVDRDGGDFGDVPIISTFQILINMTEYGSKKICEILDAVYSYLLLIKETAMETHKDIFENWQNIEKMNFRFKEDQESVKNASDGARALKVYEDLDILRGKKIPLEYDEEILKKYIDLLNQPDFNITIIDHDAEVDYDKVENYFETDYKEIEMPEEFLNAWNDRKIIPELVLPPKNEYVCTNFEIYSEIEGVEKMEYPVKIFENNIAETWFKIDSEFKTPKIFIYVRMDSPFVYKSSFNYVLTKIFITMTSKKLREKYSSAIEAGLDFSIFMLDNSIRFRFSGYSEKMELLVSQVINDFKDIHSTFNESTFNMHKEDLAERHKNILLNGRFMTSITDHLTDSKLSHYYEQFHAISELNFEHLEKFVEKCFKKLKIQILIQGNFLKSHALSVTMIILDNFDTNPVEDLTSIESLNFQIPEGRSSIKISSFQKKDVNSLSVELFDLGPRSPKTDAIGSIFETIIEEPFFDIIRTKEQLAYSLNSSLDHKDHAGYLKLALKHQEIKFSSKFIADRLKKFMIEDVKEILENLSDEKFNKIRDAKIREQLEPFNSINGEANYNMRKISDKSYIFDQYKRDARTMETITKQDMIDFYNAIFITNKPRNLSVQIVGNVEEEENDSMIMKFITEKHNEDEEIVTDLKAFKETLVSHPKYVRNYE